MDVMTVWLLVFINPVHGGYMGAVQPVVSPSAESCQHVLVSTGVRGRCVQTEIKRQ